MPENSLYLQVALALIAVRISFLYKGKIVKLVLLENILSQALVHALIVHLDKHHPVEVHVKLVLRGDLQQIKYPACFVLEENSQIVKDRQIVRIVHFPQLSVKGPFLNQTVRSVNLDFMDHRLQNYA